MCEREWSTLNNHLSKVSNTVWIRKDRRQEIRTSSISVRPRTFKFTSTYVPELYRFHLQLCMEQCRFDVFIVDFNVDNTLYCLTKISIRAKRSISRVLSLFIVPSPFFVHYPYKGRINRAESVLTGLKPY